MLLIERIVVVHECRHKVGHRRPVISGVAHKMPYRIEDVPHHHYLLGRRIYLKITNLPIKGTRELVCSERHGEMGEQHETHNIEVGREINRRNYGARTKKHERPSTDMTLHKIEVDTRLAV